MHGASGFSGTGDAHVRSDHAVVGKLWLRFIASGCFNR